MVGVTGFEPAASWSRTKRSTKLSHTPIFIFRKGYYNTGKVVCQAETAKKERNGGNGGAERKKYFCSFVFDTAKRRRGTVLLFNLLLKFFVPLSSPRPRLVRGGVFAWRMHSPYLLQLDFCLPVVIRLKDSFQICGGGFGRIVTRSVAVPEPEPTSVWATVQRCRSLNNAESRKLTDGLFVPTQNR